MDVRTEEKLVKSSDGIHTLAGRMYIPSGEIRGLVHIVHGMTEYIGRYDDLMRKIAENGYVCFGYDHLGHGKTAKDDTELGFIAHKDGWKYLIEDVKVFSDDIKREYPDLKYYLFGHSMGSFIVRLFAEKYGDGIEKLIICGTSGPIAIAPLGLVITRFLKALKGEKSYSPFAENLAFGSYNDRTEKRTRCDWLTKDREIVNRYLADKYCNFHFTISALCDLIKLNVDCNKAGWFKNISSDFPILLIAGDEDPVGNYGKGVKTVYEKLKANGKQDTEIILYQNCRHEIHNDACKDKMLEDLLSFIQK